MKLDRTVLRRLIKEELTREVEEAQLDETGGYGSAEGRAESDEHFDAAIATLRDMVDQSKASLEQIMDALRGGSDAGGHWTAGMNKGAPESIYAEGEGVETNTDPLAEASSRDETVLPQGWLFFLMGELGLDTYRSIADGMDKTNYAERLIGINRDDLVQAVSRIPESEDGAAVIDENPDSEAGDDVGEGEVTMKLANASYHQSPPGTLAPKGDKRTVTKNSGNWESHQGSPLAAGYHAPGSLLEVLEERIENLSETNAVPVHEPTGGFCGDRLGKLSGIEED
jgi:hypothetical protein